MEYRKGVVKIMTVIIIALVLWIIVGIMQFISSRQGDSVEWSSYWLAYFMVIFTLLNDIGEML